MAKRLKKQTKKLFLMYLTYLSLKATVSLTLWQTIEIHSAWQVDRPECRFRERKARGNQVSHLKHLCG